MQTIREKIRDAIDRDNSVDVIGRYVSPYEHAILGGLQRKPTYQGTVDPEEVRRRRRRNKAARAARRINR